MLGQRRIGEVGYHFTDSRIVEMDLVAAPSSGETSMRTGCHSINRRCFSTVGLPYHWFRSSHLSLGSLLDPQLEQAELLGLQVLGPDLVLGGGHNGIIEMGGNGENKTILGVSRLNERPVVVTLSYVCGCL